MANINELKVLLESIKSELGNKIDVLVAKLDEKDRRIVELETKVNALEEKAAYNDTRYNLLECRLDDSEQYSRRTSLRINGIPYNGNETSEESLQKVKGEIEKLGVKLDACEFDRAHRVGYKTDREGNPMNSRQMIVKFTTFRARSIVYRNRVKGNGERVDGSVRFYKKTKPKDVFN